MQYRDMSPGDWKYKNLKPKWQEISKHGVELKHYWTNWESIILEEDIFWNEIQGSEHHLQQQLGAGPKAIRGRRSQTTRHNKAPIPLGRHSEPFWQPLSLKCKSQEKKEIMCNKFGNQLVFPVR